MDVAKALSTRSHGHRRPEETTIEVEWGVGGDPKHQKTVKM